MTKIYWEWVRVQEILPLEVIFSYYRDMGGVLNNIVDFQKYLWDVSHRSEIIVKDQFVRVTYDTIIAKLFTHYDNKFNLCLV